jgi:hypothetical protein
MSREDHMSFEDVGRAVDLELENLKKWLNREGKPSTRQEMADGLRKISEHLAELADRLHKPPER